MTSEHSSERRCDAVVREEMPCRRRMGETIMTCSYVRSLPFAAVVLGALASSAAVADDTCRQGYVWREATPQDHVCVTPGTRAQTRDDNAHAADRISRTDHRYGPDTCVQGYVWREATPDDYVCVTSGTRSQARDDNTRAQRHRVSGRFD